MTKIYTVAVMNRFENDRTETKYFTTKEKAVKYAEKINAKYEEARANKNYGEMVYHVAMDWGIKEIVADEDEPEDWELGGYKQDPTKIQWNVGR